MRADNIRCKDQYPDTLPNQCLKLLNVCRECGTKFTEEELICRECGAKRPRCKNKKALGQDFCEKHYKTMKGNPTSIYNRLAGVIADTTLEQLVETKGTNLEEEFALAKVILAGLVGESSNLSQAELMKITREFFEIAKIKSTIEKGDTLNIKWSDDVVKGIQNKMRSIIKSLQFVLKLNLTRETIEGLYNKTIKPDDFINKCLIDIRDKARQIAAPEGQDLTNMVREVEDAQVIREPVEDRQVNALKSRNKEDNQQFEI